GVMPMEERSREAWPRGPGTPGQAASAGLEQEPRPYDFDLFVVYAKADAEFVRKELVPALDLPRERVLLVDELTPGAPRVNALDQAVSRSRFTLAVLSPAYFGDAWAAVGDHLASHVGIHGARMIALLVADA